MAEQDEPIRVAIACQGGGSHTAFTAGVLSRLFEADVTSKYKIVGLSGTSGGAICALLAWSALIEEDPARAGSLLKGFWADNSASTPPERMLNSWIQWAGKLVDYVATPAISPYDSFTSQLAMEQLRSMLQRWVDFDKLAERERALPDVEQPLLVLGAVDVLSGVFKGFDSTRGEITPDAVLASAAIPTLFRSMPADGGVYWDGLFSQNPPVRDLLRAKPDEIWLIQINAQERATEPRSMSDISDRRNELAGNLSLYQELHFIEKIDQLLEEGVLVAGNYRPVALRIIEMARSSRSEMLGVTSKMNRDPQFLDGLISHGEASADEFVTALAFESAWRAGDSDAVWAFFADDCQITSAPPFTEFEVSVADDPNAARRFIDERLTVEIDIDPTRRQFASDRFTWRVRAHGEDGEIRRGEVEATVRDRRLTSFRLLPGAQRRSVDRQVSA